MYICYTSFKVKLVNKHNYLGTAFVNTDVMAAKEFHGFKGQVIL